MTLHNACGPVFLIGGMCLVFGALGASALGGGSLPAPGFKSKVELDYLVNGRRPIWMGPTIRYTVFQRTSVEARMTALSGELVLVLPLGEQEPGQYTLPWDGTIEEGTVTFEGKYLFELFFGDEYACKFWIMSRAVAAPS